MPFALIVQAERLLDDHCKSDRSALGSAYKELDSALTKFKEEIVIDHIQPKMNSEIMEMTTGFDLFAKKWTWWLRIIISWGGAALAL